MQNLQVHTIDDFGVQLHFGIRATPKLNQPSHTPPRCYGFEVVIFAELWFRNLTTINITFGCPQLCAQSKEVDDAEDASIFESASKAAAESALLEIASVLEFGDKGKGLSGSSEGKFDMLNLHAMALQSSPQQFEEVFEYIEVENSTVKRRWWASEQYDTIVQDISSYKEGGSYWKWTDEEWVSFCRPAQVKYCSHRTPANSFLNRRLIAPAT